MPHDLAGVCTHVRLLTTALQGPLHGSLSSGWVGEHDVTFSDGDIGRHLPSILTRPWVEFRKEDLMDSQHLRVLDTSAPREELLCLGQMHQKQRVLHFLDDPQITFALLVPQVSLFCEVLKWIEHRIFPGDI